MTDGLIPDQVDHAAIEVTVDEWLDPPGMTTAGPSDDGLGSTTNTTPRNGTIFVVDDDAYLRDALTDLLEIEGWPVEAYAGAEEFLAAYRGETPGCLLVDLCLPGMGGIDLLERLMAGHSHLPVVVISGQATVPIAVRAMEAGAVSVIQKPVAAVRLLELIERAFAKGHQWAKASSRRKASTDRTSTLTPRERQVMNLVVAGHANKQIAYRLGIAQRTVESHRASVMTKTGTTSLADLVRLDFVVEGTQPSTPLERAT